MSKNLFQENSDFIPFGELENGNNGRSEPQNTPRKRRAEPPAEVNTFDVLKKKGIQWWGKNVSDKYRNVKHPTMRLHHEIQEFVKYLQPKEYEYEARMETISRIEGAVKDLWPMATVQVFGSFETKLFLPSSDIDLVVLCPDLDEDKSPLRKLARSLVRRHVANGSAIRVITRARVPIIKFKDYVYQFNVDISMNINGGLDSVPIVKKYIDTYPALAPLAMLLKQFLTSRSLNEVYTGGLGSYSLVMMLVSFFQIHPLLQLKLIKQEENLGILFLDFLELYGKNFDYEHVGISVLDGGFYFDKKEKNWTNPTRPFLLSIEDPQDPENDISKSSFGIPTVRASFDHALSILTSNICKYNRSRDKTDDKCFLNLIIAIDAAEIEHRTFVHSQFRKSKLNHVDDEHRKFSRKRTNENFKNNNGKTKPNARKKRKSIDNAKK